MENVKLAGSTTRLWTAGAIWAVVMITIGDVYFWRGEKGYGRG